MFGKYLKFERRGSKWVVITSHFFAIYIRLGMGPLQDHGLLTGRPLLHLVPTPKDLITCFDCGLESKSLPLAVRHSVMTGHSIDHDKDDHVS